MRLANTFALEAVRYSEGMRERLGQDWIPKVQDWWKSLAARTGPRGGAGTDEDAGAVQRGGQQQQQQQPGPSKGLAGDDARTASGGPPENTARMTAGVERAITDGVNAAGRSSITDGVNAVGRSSLTGQAVMKEGVKEGVNVAGRSSLTGQAVMKQGRLFGWGFDFGSLSAFQQQQQVPVPTVDQAAFQRTADLSTSPAESSETSSLPPSATTQTPKSEGSEGGAWSDEGSAAYIAADQSSPAGSADTITSKSGPKLGPLSSVFVAGRVVIREETVSSPAPPQPSFPVISSWEETVSSPAANQGSRD